MILYTIMPPEVVWATSPQGEAASEETVIDGPRYVVLSRGSDGVRRVSRLISTEPRDYLERRFQPGRVW